MTVGKDDVRFISGPPRVFDGKVIIGHGGADVGSIRGYVTAYDAETGKQLWRFWTVPGQPGVDDDETPRIAAESRSGEWWKSGGGGTAWTALDRKSVVWGTSVSVLVYLGGRCIIHKKQRNQASYLHH